MPFGPFRRQRAKDERARAERRPEVAGDATAQRIVNGIHSVDWGRLEHAYGPAGDVAELLEALTFGDEAARTAAWNELWGNVHHQGTVYEATVPAVEVIADLARWDAFPDRREALCMLGAFAEGDGRHASDVAAAVRERSDEMVRQWADEPEPVQRALLMLSRSVGLENDDLRRAVLPDRLAWAWERGTVRDIWARFGDGPILERQYEEAFDAEMDALSELEGWAFSEE